MDSQSILCIHILPRVYLVEPCFLSSISAIPLLKRLTHLPVIVDPSHATGHAWLVPPLARTVVAAGADGLMVEVHNDPADALCDGAQSLDLPQFSALMEDLKKRVLFEGKKLQ